MANLPLLVIFTDGGARSNPGPAGIGIVGYTDDEQGNRVKVFELKKYLGSQTNNFAEYTALIEGLLFAIQKGYTRIHCFADSELMVKQLNGEYKVKEPTLKPLYDQVKKLVQSFTEISFSHVMRTHNKEADLLVNKAVDEALGITKE